MPYIRQIPGHATEARRAKLDPSINAITEILLAQNTTDINAAFFELTATLCEEWADLFSKRQGKVRYYNYNDEDGVVISAIFELMRRLHFYNATFPHFTSIAMRESNKKDARDTSIKRLSTALVERFDEDRGEAVGEFNYSLSEIALGLINAKRLTPEEAVRDMYAAMHYFYDREPGVYEDASISDPEKGDTKGYIEYFKK